MGYVGLAPLGAGITNLALVVNRRHVAHAGSRAERLQRLLAQFPTVAARVTAAELVSPVRGVGPFGRRTRRATADHALLVGDAADFYDPFTGEGIVAALVGAELAGATAAGALETDRLSARDLAPYDAARRRAFGGKWALERLVGWVVARPRALAHVTRRLARTPSLADRLVSVTAHVAPPSAVLRPSYAWRLVH
jgi:menaquinone-9 beta-reductase